VATSSIILLEVGAGTPPGVCSAAVTMSAGGNSSTVLIDGSRCQNPVFTLFAKPTITDVVPAFAYRNTLVTVVGTSFATPGQGGSCVALVNATTGHSCTIIDARTVRVQLSSAPFGGACNVVLMFNAPGAIAGSGATASSLSPLLHVVPNVQIISAVPRVVGYRNMMMTLTGRHFLLPLMTFSMCVEMNQCRDSIENSITLISSNLSAASSNLLSVVVVKHTLITTLWSQPVSFNVDGHVGFYVKKLILYLSIYKKKFN
jgi:hypothetical protein